MRPCRTAGGIRQPRARRSRAASGFDSPWHKRARFCEEGFLSYLCLSKRGRAQAFPLFAFLGLTILYERQKLSYMSVKIISKSVKICSGIIFAMCFKVKIFLFFVEFFSEQISIVLIIYKSPRRGTLTIANAA